LRAMTGHRKDAVSSLITEYVEDSHALKL